MEIAELKSRFVNLLQGEEHVHQTAIQSHFSSEEYKKLVPVINELATQHRLKFHKDARGQVLFSLVSIKDAAKLHGLDQEHMLVLQEIRKTGNSGIWTLPLKQRTKLQQQVIAKILKNLEGRELVKSVRSIVSKNRKVYMMFDLTPSREHTGGPWYTDQEFDEEFVEVITNWMLAQIKAQRGVTLTELAATLRASRLVNVELSLDDVRLVLDTLIYDGKVEELYDAVTGQSARGDDDEPKWKIVNPINSNNYFTGAPCGVCPVFDQCTEGGLISPARCVYLDDWLDSAGLQF